MSNKKTEISLVPPGKDLTILLKLLAAYLNDIPFHHLDEISTDDWNNIIHLADQNKLIPTLNKAVTFNNIEIPASSRTVLKYKYGEKVYKTLGYSGLANRASKAFRSSSIAFQILKGPFLSQQAYGDLISRQYSDLDLLVDETQLERAISELEAMGFYTRVLFKQMNFAQKQYFIRYFSDLGFYDSNGFQIELHWQIFSPGLLDEAAEVQLFENLQTITIADEKISGLNPSSHLFYLIIHGYKHGWYRLSWLWDVVWLFKKLAAPEIEKTIQLARDQNLLKPVLQSLFLCHYLFQLDISKFSIFNSKLPAAEIATSWSSILRGKQETSYKGMVENLIYLLRLKKKLKYRKSVMMSQLTHYRDWEIIPLPSVLFPLYFILHPFIMMVRRKSAK